MAKKLKVISTPITSIEEPWCNPEDGTAHDVADIENFLKQSISSKAGCFYYDSSSLRYLVFADGNARDKYLENPDQNSTLLLGTFDAPANYSAEINLISPKFVPILLGSTGQAIEFTFDIKNKSGQSVGDDVLCTFTFSHGAVSNTVTRKFRAGTSVSFIVDDYLATGANSVRISIVGQTTLAATTVGVSYQVVDLALSSSFDISHVYSAQDNQLEIPYTISGYGAKTLEWFIDGKRVTSIPAEDIINEVATTRTKYISLNNLTHGAHTLQFRAYVSIDGEKFYSRQIYRKFIFSAGAQSPVISYAVDLPPSADIIPSTPVITSLKQFEPFSLDVALFNPSYASSTELKALFDDGTSQSLLLANESVGSLTFTPMTAGARELLLSIGEIDSLITLIVAESAASVNEITDSLVLALRAEGKTNQSADRDRWDYGDYQSTLSGFSWNLNSGWVNNRLLFTGDASLSVNYAPLATDATTTGKTIEFEFSTLNVSDSDAILCDLRDSAGTGLLLTASEISLRSANGVTLSSKFKPQESVRVSLVINRHTGTADKGLALLYIDGIVSAAANFVGSDNFISAKPLSFASSESASISLSDIRIYDTALTDDQILNNFILYRSSPSDFQSAFSRNNVLSEESSDFSIDALSGQVPVMIITGNIPALEATTDKSHQIDVDVEYINLQHPELYFKAVNAALRPQGTSSMAYPKKNFRLYTNKKESTVLYDADGNVVPSRKYSFTPGAQPVDCWCLKADYAESSGTHNTGIARLWNSILFNAVVDGQHSLRTSAQTAALENNYPYDVRTTVDGFPILIFYRQTASDVPIFIGKYNFNNDKSTESVFGFTDIPGFDNSNTQCWELLNNGHHLALFKDTDNWDDEWADAFEGRFPDGNTDTSLLKEFAEWISTVSAADFTSEKYQHLDIPKVAAYYVYLMTFGAVDQVVKNSMFTSEDGQHWFFINYDNDTINGLRNDGPLIYPPTIDRQTLDGSFTSEVYAYAGHDSRLWNLLESDPDFMQMVAKVYQALFIAGLSYDKSIEMFDTHQAGAWCERVYNRDARYKYLSPFADRGVNNLFMLQGSRRSHRRWWLSERFYRMDATFVGGEYKANTFEVKLAGAPAGLEFSITAASDMLFGYGVNDVPMETKIALSNGESHTFTTSSVLNVGDPLRLYAAPYLRDIDISGFLPYISQLSIAGVASSRLGTSLKSLIIGDNSATQANYALTELSGISQATRLEVLNIAGCKGLTAIDLSSNHNLRSLDARNTSISSVIFAQGAPIEFFAVPDSMRALVLDSLPLLTSDGLLIGNHGWNISDIHIHNCPGLDSLSLITEWISGKSTHDINCSLSLEGINWKNVDVELLLRFGSFRSLSLKGVVEVNEISEQQLSRLYEIFGRNCFNPNAELYIKSNSPICFIMGPDDVKALSSASYEVISVFEGTYTLSLVAPPPGVTLENGSISVGDLTESKPLTLSATFVKPDGSIISLAKSITIVPRSYPTTGTLSALDSISAPGTYTATFSLNDLDFDGDVDVEFSIDNLGDNSSIATIGETSYTDGIFSVDLIVHSVPEETVTFDLIAQMKVSESNRELFSKSFTIVVSSSPIAITRSVNPNIMSLCYSNGWAANPNYMTLAECDAVSGNIGNPFYGVNSPSFNEYQYFKNASITSLSFRYIKEVTYPISSGTGVSTGAGLYLREAYFPYLATFSVGYTSTSPYLIQSEYLELAEFPILTSCSGSIIFKDLPAEAVIKAPVLKTVTCYSRFISGSIKKIDFPALESITARFQRSSSSAPAISLIDSTGVEVLSLPSLKTLSLLNTSSYNGILPSISHIKNIDLSSLTALPIALCSNQETLPNETSSPEINLRSLERANKPIWVPGCESPIIPSFDLSSLQWSSANPAIYCPIGELHLPSLTSGSEFLQEDHVEWMDETGYSSSLHIGSAVTSLGLLFDKIAMLKDIYIEAMTAPSIMVGTGGAGSGLPEGTEKTIYVPAGATGYDSGNWPEFLETCGYNLSYTL
ncbi:MAG: CotH kinase family protein [Muribaculaceae bacterium]|nr:CotH kinase family protein [Muribaculaceae bacterium]